MVSARRRMGLRCVCAAAALALLLVVAALVSGCSAEGAGGGVATPVAESGTSSSQRPSAGDIEHHNAGGGVAGPVSGNAPAAPNRPTPQTTPVPEGSELIVRFVDVGQGDCAIISCDGHHLLIDGGSPEVSRKVYAVVEDLGIERFDAIVATHPDSDHIGGISAALNVAGADVCYCSTDTSDTKSFASLLKNLGRVGCPLQIPQAGASFALGSATVTFVGPVTFIPESDNDNSLVCRIDFGSTSFLFTGDAEAAEEASLVDAGALLSADVLKVGHHGSSSSSTPAFLQAVGADFAVISVGAGNDYGHPTQKTLKNIAATGATIYRTDEQGSIIAKSDGEHVTFTAVELIEE